MIRSHKPPLFFPLLALIVGIVAQQYLRLSPYLLFSLLGMALGLLAIVTCCRRYEKIIVANVMVVCLLGGAGLLQLQQQHYERLLARYAGKSLDVRGVVIDREFRTEGSFSEILTMRVTSVKRASERREYKIPAQSTSFIMQVYVRDHTSCAVDDEIRLFGVTIRRVEASGISRNQSFQDYLIKEGIVGTVFLYDAQRVRLVQRPPISWARSLWMYRQGLLDRLVRLLSRRAYQYVTSMFLGNRNEDDISAMRASFVAWGTVHYLARSGLHIVLFLMLWRLLLSLVPIGIRLKQLGLLIVALLYTVISWSSVSFMRALYVFLIMQFGALCLLTTHFLHLLTVVCFGLLLYNPMYLFFLDFQLTFLLTAVLSLYAPPWSS